MPHVNRRSLILSPLLLVGTQRPLRSQEGPLWTPDYDGNDVKAWWTTKDIGSITTDGGAVSAWASQRGGFVLRQDQVAARPTFQATGWDGTWPAIAGDGHADHGRMLSISRPSTLLAPTQSIFIVAERGIQQDDTRSGYRPLVCTAPAVGHALWMASVSRPGAPLNPRSFRASGTGPGHQPSVAITPFAAGRKSVLFAQFGADGHRANVDGGGLGVRGIDGRGANTTSSFQVFGDASNPARRFAGKIVEIVVYHDTFTDEERDLRIAGLAWGWGIQ